MRARADQRELFHDNVARYMSPGYSYVNRELWTRRLMDAFFADCTYFWYKDRDNFWCLGEISADTFLILDGTILLSGRARTGQARPASSSVRYDLEHLTVLGGYSYIKGTISCAVLCAARTISVGSK